MAEEAATPAGLLAQSFYPPAGLPRSNLASFLSYRTWAVSCLVSLLSPPESCSRRMAAASFRHGLTIAGAVLLVTGTLCFAWWSDGEVGSGTGARLLPPREAEAVPSSSSSSPSALLRSVSFFCCGIGGILLIFGLLWSVKANARLVSRRYRYHFPRDLQYFTAEPAEKWNCRWEPRPCRCWQGQRRRVGPAVPEPEPAPGLAGGELTGAAQSPLRALVLLPEQMLLVINGH